MTRGALSLFVGRVVSALTTVVVLALVARTSTLEALGVVALGLTVGLTLAVLSEAGLTALFIYDIADAPERSSPLLGAMVVIRAVTLPAVAIVTGILVLIAYPEVGRTIMIVALGPALQQVSELARSVFIARRRMAIASAHSIVENVAWAGVIAFGLASGMELDSTFAAAAVAVVICVVGAFLLVAILERVWPMIPSRSDLSAILRRGGPFTAFSTLAVVAARMDTVLVALLLPDGLAAAGAYFTVARLAAAAEYLPEAVSRAIYPSLVRHYPSDRPVATSILARAARELLAIGLAIPLGIVLIGGTVLGLIYGDAIRAFDWLLLGFGLAMPFRYLGMLFGFALTSADRQTSRLVALAISVVVSLVLSLWLLPTIGIAGALLAIVTGWLVNCLLVSRDILTTFGRVLVPGDVVRGAIVAAVAFAIGILIGSVVPGTAGELIGGLVFGLIVLAGAVGPRSLRIFGRRRVAA